MGKRSPILGYNHNVRHRGLLFHVQTEDSGVDNPHIFTHLFHGGVIISTRRLDYDAGSAEDVVKALMQAQHKATLKELKGGVWDEKIDAYLGTHPDLLPAGPARREGRDTVVEPPPPFEDGGGPLPVEPKTLEPSPAQAGGSLGDDLASPSEPPALPLARGTGGVAPAQPGARAGRNSNGPDGRGRTHSLEPGQPLRGDEVSAAFAAISVDEPSDDVASAAPAAPLEADDAATTQRLDRVDLPPQAQGPTPPPTPTRGRQTSGAYHQHRRIVDRLPEIHDRLPEIHDQPTAPLPRKRARNTSSAAPKAAGTPPPVPRQTAPPIPIAPRPGRGVNAVVRPAGKPHAPASPPVRAAGRARMPPVPPARSAQGQVRASVVVSRPAVIVGGPPRVIGGSGPTSGRSAAGPGSDPPRAVGGRRAREEPSRPKLFGKDLISEKSLDEVILAYLSEDSGGDD